VEFQKNFEERSSKKKLWRAPLQAMNSPKKFGGHLLTCGVPKKTLESISSRDELPKKLWRTSLEERSSKKNFGGHLFKR
jgi:hypothetical protein